MDVLFEALHSTGQIGEVRSTLVIRHRQSASGTYTGYLSGLSSPSVTLSSATLEVSPTSNSRTNQVAPTFLHQSRSEIGRDSPRLELRRTPLTIAASRLARRDRW